MEDTGLAAAPSRQRLRPGLRWEPERLPSPWLTEGCSEPCHLSKVLIHVFSEI